MMAKVNLSIHFLGFTPRTEREAEAFVLNHIFDRLDGSGVWLTIHGIRIIPDKGEDEK